MTNNPRGRGGKRGHSASEVASFFLGHKHALVRGNRSRVAINGVPISESDARVLRRWGDGQWRRVNDATLNRWLERYGFSRSYYDKHA